MGPLLAYTNRFTDKTMKLSGITSIVRILMRDGRFSTILESEIDLSLYLGILYYSGTSIFSYFPTFGAHKTSMSYQSSYYV